LKILLLIAVIVVGLAVFRNMKRAAQGAVAQRPAENMVRCARCGVNLPRSEALCDRGVCVCPPGQPCERSE